MSILCVDMNSKKLLRPQTEGFLLLALEVTELEDEDLEMLDYNFQALEAPQYASLSTIPFGNHLITTWDRFQLAHWQQAELILGETIAVKWRQLKNLPADKKWVH